MRTTRAPMQIALCVLALCQSAMRAHAQVEQHPVHWSALGGQTSVRAGDTVRVLLHATIAEFFHLYSITQPPGGPVRTSVVLVPGGKYALVGRVRVRAPDTIPDGNFGIMTEVYDDSVTLGITLRAETRLSAGRSVALVGVRYQACTARYCLPPRVDSIRIALVVARRAADGASASIELNERTSTLPSPPTMSATQPVSGIVPRPPIVVAGSTGAVAFLILAATMGALALLTPCVFPMIPMTVTSFLGNAGDRRQGLVQATLYAIGIIASFTGLGVLTAAVFGAAGLARFAASPAVNLGIAALFVVFALSLIGVVRLSTPRALLDRILGTNGESTAGPFAMGVVFTLTAFTCTAPFIGTLLVMAARGSRTWPLVGMLVFSTVFAAPFFLLALAPGVLRRRPRGGDWMPTIEVTLGALELAAAIKFISNADLVLRWRLFTRDVVLSLWLAILIALAAALARPRLLRAFDGATRVGRVRMATVVVLLAVAASLVPGLFGRRLGELDAFLPPLTTASPSSGDSSKNGELPWMLDDYGGALTVARHDGRPILVDFTGYTCTNCRWMEANMFPRADVARALRRFVRIRLYTDGLGEPYASQQALEQRLFGTVALPLYAVLDAEGHPRATFLGMTRDAREFAAFLAQGTPEH